MQRDLTDFALIAKEGGGGGRHCSQENLDENCQNTRLACDFTGLFHTIHYCLSWIADKSRAVALRTFFYKIVREIAVATVMAIAVSASDVAVAARGKAASKAVAGIGATVRAAALELIRAAFRPVLSAIAAVVARIGAADAVLGTVIEAIASIMIAAKAIVARISMMISATSVTTAVSRLVSQIFSRLFLTPSSPRPSTKHYATPALLTVAFRCLNAVCSVVWNLCSKLKSSRIARIWCSAFSSLAGVACSLTFVKDFALKTPALLSLAFNNFYTKSRRQDLLKNSLK